MKMKEIGPISGGVGWGTSLVTPLDLPMGATLVLPHPSYGPILFQFCGVLEGVLVKYMDGLLLDPTPTSMKLFEKVITLQWNHLLDRDHPFRV